MILILRCKECNQTKRLDNVSINWLGHFQSITGGIDYKCPLCQRRMMGSLLECHPNPKAPCGKHCRQAMGTFCTCSCNGENHGINHH